MVVKGIYYPVMWGLFHKPLLGNKNPYLTANISWKVSEFWLVVSTPLKNIGQNGNLPQMGVNIKKIKPPHRQPIFHGKYPRFFVFFCFVAYASLPKGISNPKS